jgi:hypothetical protein
MNFSVNELMRYLITLHLSLNDLLRRSVDLMRSAYTNHYQTRNIRRNRNSNKIVLSGSCVFSERTTYRIRHFNNDYMYIIYIYISIYIYIYTSEN